MQRSLVYQRAKNENADKPFGTILDVYAPGYSFMVHSIQPCHPADPATFRITIGNSQCKHQYSASIFNISAMSFGSLSANAIRALNLGAAKGHFYHDTGEGSISPYHLEHGGDLVWELGSGYFGCRTLDGTFDPKRFAEQAKLPQVKMIEIKLSQGAKPGHGGILPKDKISEEIAQIRHISREEDCISPARHSAFSNPIELMHFIQQLRELSQGKPVGFKLCVGQPWQFMALVKAMLHTQIYPDFIVVDGSEGGTGASPIELINYMGTPLREGLRIVHNTLVGAGIRDQIKLGASGKIISAFDIANIMAIGADWVNSARGFMFSVGCIQAQSCHTNQCPVGVATQDLSRQKALHVPTKAERVFQFHEHTLHALAELLASAGLSHPADIQPHHLAQRVNDREIKNYAQLYAWLKHNELLDPALHDPEHFYHRMWAIADMQHF
jgi:glutamate synthase domain-containing protein 2